MNQQPSTTILLDIYEKLGGIESTLKSMKEDHNTMAEDIEDLKTFKARIGAYIWFGGAIATGACVLLWNGLTYFSTEIRAALGKLFH